MNTEARSRRRGAAAALALVALLFGALGTAVSAAPASEVPGNNGTVKIHDGAGEPATEVRNEPHVCTFHMHFLFADAADAGTWEIQEWSPGDKGIVVKSGTYLTDVNGEDRDPEAGAYSLPDGHYKLFWDGDLDTDKHDKHKVFWVDCATPTPTPTPVVISTATPTATPEGGVLPTATPTATPEGGVLPTATAVTPTETPVVTPTPTPTPAVGEVGGATGTPTPSGAVGAATGLPGTTLPPTDTIAHSTTGTGSGLGMVLMLLAAMFASISLGLVLMPRRIRGS